MLLVRTCKGIRSYVIRSSITEYNTVIIKCESSNEIDINILRQKNDCFSYRIILIQFWVRILLFAALLARVSY